jgi:hypothetical protein
MERAVVERHDVTECESIRRKHDLTAGGSLCEKIEAITETAARLDATQHGRLSSAAR